MPLILSNARDLGWNWRRKMSSRGGAGSASSGNGTVLCANTWSRVRPSRHRKTCPAGRLRILPMNSGNSCLRGRRRSTEPRLERPRPRGHVLKNNYVRINQSAHQRLLQSGDHDASAGDSRCDQVGHTIQGWAKKYFTWYGASTCVTVPRTGELRNTCSLAGSLKPGGRPPGRTESLAGLTSRPDPCIVGCPTLRFFRRPPGAFAGVEALRVSGWRHGRRRSESSEDWPDRARSAHPVLGPGAAGRDLSRMCGTRDDD